MGVAFLITGTDTGVGKTTVASAVAAALAGRGLSVGVLKPAETGCAVDADGQLLARDAAQLRWFAGSGAPLDAVCPYPLPDPLAPALAAHRAGVVIDLDDLLARIGALRAAHDVALVEGAGGLLVPLTLTTSFLELAAAADLPLLLVVGNRLGCVNHAALTVRCARAAGVRVAGYIVNTLQPEPDLAMETNAALLAELLGPSLGTFPWVGRVACTDAERTRLAKLAEHHLQLDALLDGRISA